MNDATDDLDMQITQEKRAVFETFKLAQARVARWEPAPCPPRPYARRRVL